MLARTRAAIAEVLVLHPVGAANTGCETRLDIITTRPGARRAIVVEYIACRIVQTLPGGAASKTLAKIGGMHASTAATRVTGCRRSATRATLPCHGTHRAKQQLTWARVNASPPEESPCPLGRAAL